MHYTSVDLNATSATIFCFTSAWLQMQILLGYLALSKQLWRLSQNDSAVKIKQDFLGVIFCCPMEIVPPQMKIQCDRCVIFHSVSSSLSVASLSCLFAVETSLYLLLKHVPVDPFISFSFIHSSLTLSSIHLFFILLIFAELRFFEVVLRTI